MKKVLVTGAAGTVGVHVVKYLLAEGKYEVTILDLKNKNSFQKLKRFRKRVNILYGDIMNNVLIEALVKDQDIIIHLASVLPPLSDMKKGLSEAIEYQGCENIIRAITYYNPKCHFIYASTTSIYNGIENPSVKSKIKKENLTYFAESKLKTEELIKDKLKNYTILRVPLVLSNLVNEPFIYNIKKQEVIDVITKEDCAYAFVRAIRYLDKINKKTYDLSMAEPILYDDLLKNILKYRGLSFSFLFNKLFVEKNYVSPVTTDKDDLEEIISYRNDTIQSYYNRIKRQNKNRKLAKILAKPFLGKQK